VSLPDTSAAIKIALQAPSRDLCWQSKLGARGGIRLDGLSKKTLLWWCFKCVVVISQQLGRRSGVGVRGVNHHTHTTPLLSFIVKAKALPLHSTEALVRERRYSSYSFSISALDWVSGQRHAWPHFSPGERTLGTHCTGGWMGPRAGLETECRGKILLPVPGIEPRSPGSPVRSQTLYWLSYPAHKS
jgi:hypothetical protein